MLKSCVQTNIQSVGNEVAALANIELAKQLKEQLAASGASIVGFAGLEIIEPDIRQGFPVGVSIAVAMDPDIVAQISDGPTKDYEAEYDRVKPLADSLSALCVEILQADGYKAVAIPSSEVTLVDYSTLSTTLPHKTAATRAGIGWIGKCALLITEEYGSAVWLTTVLTNAELPLGTPIEESRCGACSACIEACPASAPTGEQWSESAARSDILDAFACLSVIRKFRSEQGYQHPICGMCITACPWTKKYLSVKV